MSGYRGRDAGRALADALIGGAARAGIALTIVDANSRPWESATFSGARHRVTVAVEGLAGTIDAWLAGLPNHEFRLGAHIVADIAVTERDGGSATIEALTVADR